jgi:hypothetical protein
METRAINETAVFKALGRRWCTAHDLVSTLRAPKASLRKIAQILKTLEGVHKLEGRARMFEGQGQGRPSREFRRI